MPVSDDDLRSAAYALSGAMTAMLAADGLDPDILGVPDHVDGDVIARSLEVDAELYMSMSPARLTEEYNEILDAATTTKRESDPNGFVESARSDIEAWWVGEASRAFTVQCTKIQNCIDSQFEYTVLAAQAIGMMYAVNAQFRASCLDLMEKTAQTCRSVTDGLGSPDAAWAEAGIGLFRAAIDAIKNADPSKITSWAVEQIWSQVGSAVSNTTVPGAEAIPVVSGYVAARDRLFAAYEDNLDGVGKWISARREDLAGLTMAIPEPLPPCTDVDSPDFRYEGFHIGGDMQGDFGAEVDRERQKYVAEKTKPDGVITHRLSGQG
jgi:hypothetical protein